MAKIHGVIGYVETVETAPGKWMPSVTERQYFGTLIRNARRLQTSGEVNEDISISNEISIVADSYAKEHLQNMRYVELMNAKWKITNINIQYPRIILTIGGLYNATEA